MDYQTEYIREQSFLNNMIIFNNSKERVKKKKAPASLKRERRDHQYRNNIQIKISFLNSNTEEGNEE